MAASKVCPHNFQNMHYACRYLGSWYKYDYNELITYRQQLFVVTMICFVILM